MCEAHPDNAIACLQGELGFFFFSPSNYLNGVLAPFSLKQDITFIDIVAAATSVKLTERRSWPILMMDLVLSAFSTICHGAKGSLLPVEGSSILARKRTTFLCPLS